jgi:hypothetical protein
VNRLNLAGAVIELHDSGLTRTLYAWGDVPAWPQDDEAYRARAFELGYGADTALMSREHELMHHLIAHWLGLPLSPTLAAVASGSVDDDWRLEEAAVLAIQAFARAKGINLVDLAKKGINP